jgi:hypothetical protein
MIFSFINVKELVFYYTTCLVVFSNFLKRISLFNRLMFCCYNWNLVSCYIVNCCKLMLIESLVEQNRQFDVVCAMEIVEHVADVPSFLNTCQQLLKVFNRDLMHLQ